LFHRELLLAVQYQPTACVYIHSPTHDHQIAADVRAAWSSDNPAERLLASLKADFGSENGYNEYRHGAVLRLGYYFPEKSETLLLELLTKIDSPPRGDSKNRSSYENIELLEAIVASKSQAVRERVYEMMKTTKDVHYFLALSQAYGAEHDSLILQRAKKFINTLPDDEDSPVQSVLVMMGERFPAEARKIFVTFVESQSLHRRDAVINALWYSPLAPELLPPLLADKRGLRYLSGGRVCDRAAQAISNNEKAISFNDEATEKSRDEQIQKIKLHCIGIGVRKTGGNQ
jgi:hypothetical protein